MAEPVAVENGRGRLGWADGAGADAVRAFLHVDGLGQRDHGVLAAVVGGAGHRRRVLARPGRNVDHQAVLARAHRRQHRVGAVEGAVEIDADHLAPAGDGLVAPVALRIVQSGAVDQDVDLAVARQDAMRHPATAGASVTSSASTSAAAACGNDAASDTSTSPRRPDSTTVAPAAASRLRARQADAGARAGDPGDFSVQTSHRNSPGR